MLEKAPDSRLEGQRQPSFLPLPLNSTDLPFNEMVGSLELDREREALVLVALGTYCLGARVAPGVVCCDGSLADPTLKGFAGLKVR